ncbi:2-amino-4-hydroxy-6-hydroxymethyldihydropteridine diphosphokinase [Hahella sp. KA22]|uniref:2-amino-4-hydroxy-6- hydroxymethyldihydropteridine diphosphokinase n=1 Tax=Hahella sp. KA22 TaxID=1628392 RepID=UPI000FDD9FB4|nr:2-amino-4-hydroxy-6-hydroxymethyldihydropteridine diphosphokinase [Hahella sp. KA22]AZZ94661.1 2-amino-4-hydroxy-6-hydroxymethyldihydropteridine diphosphokinase [Hahella sp. KA22]QAY58034.1 2-amino-4-hydroxy-6-hydroxymethyldihydropteridine diphosphokinase [Hahella sp. KA22]
MKEELARVVKVVVGIGSNIDPDKNIALALDALDAHFQDLRLSPVYESEAIGFAGDAFINLVAAFHTDESVGAVQRTLKQIEASSGRTGLESKHSGRTLDIDILTYGDVVGEVEGIALPRGEITENAYVLLPLAELEPNERHPALNVSYAELWEKYDRAQQLHRVAFSWRDQTF